MRIETRTSSLAYPIFDDEVLIMTRQYEDTKTRRRQVADAALQTIMQDGVGGFTTRAVAERVGISDGTLFRHFGSKKDIMLEAMSRLEVELLGTLLQTGTPLENLESFFKERAIFVGEKDAVGALVFSSELLHLVGDDGKKKLKVWRRKTMKFLGDQLSILQEEGRTHPELDIMEMSMLIQGTLLTFAMQRTVKNRGTRKELDQRINKAWKVLFTVLFV